MLNITLDDLKEIGRRLSFEFGHNKCWSVTMSAWVTECEINTSIHVAFPLPPGSAGPCDHINGCSSVEDAIERLRRHYSKIGAAEEANVDLIALGM